MSKITIKAVFKGQDGSCGYKHGMEYKLNVHHSRKENIEITMADKPLNEGFCEYESFISFIKNWDLVRFVLID